MSLYFVQLRIAKVNTKTPTTFFSTFSMFDDRLNVIVGLHGHHAKQIKKNGENKKYHGVNPTFGLNYKISENFSVYASHAEDS